MKKDKKIGPSHPKLNSPNIIMIEAKDQDLAVWSKRG